MLFVRARQFLILKYAAMRFLVMGLSYFFCCTAASAQQCDTFTIYFGRDSSELTTAAIANIDSMVSLHKKTPVRQLIVLGYADHTGDSMHNTSLSARRATRVKDHLVHKGLMAEMRMCSGQGEISRRRNDKDDLAADRKVLIIMQSVAGSGIVSHPPAKRAPTLSQQLDTLKINEAIVLKDIHFKDASPILMPSSEPYLLELYNYLAYHKSVSIKIEGHVCCFGPGSLTDDGTGLSALRARTINDFLVSNGIDQARIQYEGLGNANPLTHIELTEAHRELNRRVEIRVTIR
jgi:outer membrane protein OmpA-like peptidoglycan-associated protein